MRRLLMIGLGICLFFIVLVALFPTIANTDWGRKQVIKFVNQSIPGRLDIRAMHLRWGHGQVLEGVLLKDPESQSVLGIEQLSTDASLWQLWRHSTRLGHTQIKDLNAAIVTNSQGVTNVQRALGLQDNFPALDFLPSTIVLSDVQADFYLFAPNRPFSLAIQGNTKQEQLVGSFNTKIVLEGLQANTWKDFSQNAQKYLSLEGSREATIYAQVTRFPVDLIDRLIALKYPQLNGLFHSLIGDQLNLTVGNENNADGLAFHLEAKAPLMQGTIKGKIVNESIVLQEPATLLFQLEPEAINSFIHEQLTLEQKTQLKATFQELTIPLTVLNDQKKVTDPCQFGFKGQVSSYPTIVNVPTVGKVELLNFQAFFDAPLCDKIIDLHFTGEAQQGKEPFNIQFHSTFAKPTHLSQVMKQWKQTMESSLKIKNFPLKLLPSLREYSEVLQEIGKTINIQLSTKPTQADEWIVSLAMQTDQITLNKTHFKAGKDLVLTEPCSIQWMLSPRILQAFFKDERWTLDQKNPIQLIVKNLSLPLNDHPLIKLKMDGTLSELQFSKLLPALDSKLHIQDVNLAIDGLINKELNTTIQAKISVLDSKGAYSPLFPRPLEVSQQSIWKWDAQQVLSAPDIQLTLTSPFNSLKVNGQLFPAKQQFVLTQPAELNYLLTPEGEQRLAHLLDFSSINLSQAVPFQLTVNPTTLDWQHSLYQSLTSTGKLVIKQAAFQNAQISSDLLPILKNLVLSWDVQGAKNLIQTQFTGQATTKAAQASQLQAQVKVDRWLQNEQIDLSQALIDIQAQFDQLPTSLLNLAVGSSPWTSLVGPTFNLNVKSLIDQENHIPGFWDMHVESSTLLAEGRLKIDQAVTLLDTQQPATFRLTVTPDNYQKLFTPSPTSQALTLATPVTISGQLSQLYFPLTAELEKVNPGQLKIDLSTSDMRWREIPQLLQLKAQLESQHLMNAMHLTMDLISSTAAKFQMQTSVERWLTPEKSLNDWQKMHVNSHFTLQEFSPSLLRALLFLDEENEQKIQALLGDSIQMEMTSHINQLSGPLAFQVKGSNGLLEMKGQLKQGVLTLQEPLKGEFRVTPLLGSALFSKNVPVLSSLLDAENPIRLSIESENFSAPLVPFVMDQIQIGKGTLDFGKMRFRNEGELYAVLKLIHPIPDQQLTVWFTPIYFHLAHSQLLIKRVDLLVANAYELASWGKVDLSSHQMDMTLGLSAQALKYAFGIDKLDKNYMLQVPLRSRQGKIELDQKRITARIGTLLAQTRAGKAGQLIGSILDTAMNDQGEPHPEPTTSPLPWAHEFDSLPPSNPSLEREENNKEDASFEDSSDKKSKKKHKKKDQAMQILNQFFK
jgi:hypothetical protein